MDGGIKLLLSVVRKHNSVSFLWKLHIKKLQKWSSDKRPESRSVSEENSDEVSCQHEFFQ